jgi:hypothetical protein
MCTAMSYHLQDTGMALRSKAAGLVSIMHGCKRELDNCAGFRQVYLRTYVSTSDHYFASMFFLNDIACVHALEVCV